MNRKVFAALLAGLFLCMILFVPVRGALGFGDFDSGSDWGGSDSGGSDWGGSDWGGSDWGGSDHDSGSYRYRDRDSSGGSGGSAALGFLIWILIIVFCLITRSIGGSSGSRSSGTSGTQTPRKRAETINRIPMDMAAYSELREQRDPGYSEDGLFRYVRKLFREMQDSWEAGDITDIQYGFLPDTWQRFATQLRMKNQRGETTHVRDIEFKEIRVTGFRSLPNEDRDKIQIEFKVAYNVWVTNKSGENIQGTPSTRHLMTYLWTMERPYSTKTLEASADASHCPNCGAELDVAAFAECPFCHTQLRRESANWAIRDIQAESQVTLR